MWPLLFCQKYSIILYKTFVTQFIIFHWTNWENMWDTKLYDWRHVNTSFTSYKHKINLHKWRCRFSRFKKNCDIQKFEMVWTTNNGIHFFRRPSQTHPSLFLSSLYSSSTTRSRRVGAWYSSICIIYQILFFTAVFIPLGKCWK